jgi:ABC-2 type transport system ATP-binding protein
VPPVVTVVDVTKRWSATPALTGATFTVNDGVTGLLGANGAGKTTLLGLILGLHRPDGGAITVFGRDPWVAGAEVRARLGYAPEHDALPPDVAAHDVVRHLAELHGLPRREATSRASDALWEVGLGEERFRPVGTMSTGQRQRVKLAQAIVHDPELLLLDEPTNGLDPSQREDMLGLIEHVGADLGMHVILSSHLLEEVERVSSSVVILDAGRVVADGGIAELRQTTPELLVELDPVDGATPAEDLTSALRRAGLSVAPDGPRRVVVALEGPAVYDSVRDVLAEGAYSVRRLERRTASLEEIYLASAGNGRAALGSGGGPTAGGAGPTGPVGPNPPGAGSRRTSRAGSGREK